MSPFEPLRTGLDSFDPFAPVKAFGSISAFRLAVDFELFDQKQDSRLLPSHPPFSESACLTV